VSCHAGHGFARLLAVGGAGPRLRSAAQPDFAASSSLRTASSAPEVLEVRAEPAEPEPVFLTSPELPLQPASFGHSFSSDDDPHAWAQRLRNIPDKARRRRAPASRAAPACSWPSLQLLQLSWIGRWSLLLSLPSRC